MAISHGSMQTTEVSHCDTGIAMDVGIYNIMLRIYNNNDHPIVPSEYLEQMKADNVFPNMV